MMVIERTLELPILVHDMLGLGLPDTLELNEMLPPSSITTAEIDTCTDGATTDVIQTASIASCTYAVDRNASVLSIFFHSDVKHTRAAVTNKFAIKVEVICMGSRIGIYTTLQHHCTTA